VLISAPELISIAEDAYIILACSSVAEPAEWQSEDVWRNQQDKSQAEAESDVETMSRDTSAGRKLMTLRME
jgi:hypothetical protein